MRIFSLFMLFLFALMVKGQNKKGVSFDDISSWPSVASDGIITANGKYVAFTIENRPVGSSTLFLKAVNGTWNREFLNAKASDGVFTDDSRHLICKIGSDSLCVIGLDDRVVRYFKIGGKWSLLGKGSGQHLAVITRDTPGHSTLLLLNLETFVEQRFENVSNFYNNQTSSVLVFFDETKKELSWIDVQINQLQSIFKGKGVSKVVLDRSGSRLAFARNSYHGTVEYMYYDVKFRTLICLDSIMPAYSDSAMLSGIDRFSSNGSALYIKMSSKAKKSYPQRKDVADVTIWGTDDLMPPLFKLTKELPGSLESQTYLSMILLPSGKFVRLESGDTTAEQCGGINADWFIRTSGRDKHSVVGSWSELVSGNTGQRWSLKGLASDISTSVRVSPSGKYIVYYDMSKAHHCSYNVYTHETIFMTANVSNTWVLEGGHDQGKRYPPFYSGWFCDDKQEKVYIGDGNDIWLLDASGKDHPQNITLGIGRKREIVFSFVEDAYFIWKADKSKKLLYAFSKRDKSAGFTFVYPGREIKTLDIDMQPYFYYSAAGMNLREMHSSYRPLHAANSDIYLTKRMTAASSPNYYLTKNFRDFKLLSDNWPEKKINWLYSELVEWKDNEGRLLNGILFKPEDFDSTKKYPVIMTYYEQDADGLHLFRNPALMDNNLNIPWFVTRGYLVFLQDIFYRTGHPGESSYSCVNSAADCLSGYSYVDKDKMGIMGHSFGGYETNAIVTRTGRFAAAVSASGISDLIAFYGDIRPGFKIPMQEHVEEQQFRMGKSLWEAPVNYFENSPVLRANKVTTPLLLINNIHDPNVPFMQGVSFFMALRRCNKKAWLLQYDNGAHRVLGNTGMIDYTSRITQFFDYYLKGIPMAGWMNDKGEAQFKRYIN